MLRALIIVAALAGCSDSDGDGPLLSASRLALAERQTARVHVDVSRVDDFDYVAPDGIVITKLEDVSGPAFDVTPSCGAAASMDADVVIEVRDRKTTRKAALVVAVDDDATDACAIDIAMWLEPCSGSSCAVPCGSRVDAPLLALGRKESARLCVNADALDPSRPLADEQLAIEPATQGFRIIDSHTAIIEGADWLVGPYRATFTATAGALPIVHTRPLDIGAPGDIGIELAASTFDQLPAEFLRITMPITVHRFPTVDDACEIVAGAAMGDASLCPAGNYRLYANGVMYLPCEPVACGASAHAPFSLSYVPQIDASATVVIPLSATAGQNSGMRDAVFDGIESRAENLSSTLAPDTVMALACADADDDGALEVVVGSGTATVVYSLVGWRDPLVARIEAPRPDRIFSIDGPRVLGISSAGIGGASLWELGGSVDGWSWQSKWTNPALMVDAVPIRRTSLALPGHLVGLDSNVLSFITIDGQPLGTVTPADLTAGAYAIGVVDVGGDGDDLVIVGFDPADPFFERQKIWVYQLDWSQAGTTKAPTLTTYATTIVTGMPTATHSIASRRVPNGDDDLIVSFSGGTFASAVAEYALGPGSLSLLIQFGSVRSVASASDGSVLYGQEGGARSSIWTTFGVQRAAIDPIVELAPQLEYGRLITACTGASSFVVQTADHELRAAHLGIVPDTP